MPGEAGPNIPLSASGSGTRGKHLGAGPYNPAMESGPSLMDQDAVLRAMSNVWVEDEEQKDCWPRS